jgi:hypothetical protein
MKFLILVSVSALVALAALDESDLVKARDRQDRSALQNIVNDVRATAEKEPKDAAAQYRLALAESYTAEVAI